MKINQNSACNIILLQYKYTDYINFLLRKEKKEKERKRKKKQMTTIREIPKKDEFVSNCCGVSIIENTDLCSSCNNHCGIETEENHYN